MSADWPHLGADVGAVSQHSNCHTMGITTTEVMPVSQSLDLCNEMSSHILTVCPGCDVNSHVNHSDRADDLCATTNAHRIGIFAKCTAIWQDQGEWA